MRVYAIIHQQVTLKSANYSRSDAMKKNIPQNICKNTFVESDGFCNACGKRHFNPRKDASKQRLVSKPVSGNTSLIIEKESSNEQK